ncbi:L,D-transpeptidase family protein [Streptosporangium sp. NBC_01639]|uniref:L,D-transpeptidase family protein n=1 Tax=Streptosporangium sp. NBC_01639 TaxID=2975948 RepID=UPI00386F5272|nr:L,D-transpeptidase family protein [Streptosporangium sp. NBC_01639]
MDNADRRAAADPRTASVRVSAALLALVMIFSGFSGTRAASAAEATLPPPSPGRQLITVRADSYQETTATLVAYTAQDGRWVKAYGPWTANVGENGIAPPGQKREGDGRTPSGTFGFDFMFGIKPDPGVRFPYRQVFSYDKWDDDPTSPLYNTWVDARRADPGADPENMANPPAYDHGAVIAYNTENRTPYLGSAIFLHASTGAPTAGCVSLPVDELLQVLRWMDPKRSPQIDIRVA